MWDTDTMYKQVISTYVHACMQIELQAQGTYDIVTQATPSLRKVWLARGKYLHYRYIFSM